MAILVPPMEKQPIQSWTSVEVPFWQYRIDICPCNNAVLGSIYEALILINSRAHVGFLCQHIRCVYVSFSFSACCCTNICVRSATVQVSCLVDLQQRAAYFGSLQQLNLLLKVHEILSKIKIQAFNLPMVKKKSILSNLLLYQLLQ